MREIKFRVWDKKKKVIIPHSRLFRLDTSNELPFLPLLEKFTVDYEVMQYTGLKDKNGTPIYEGDIINGCEVYWSTQWCMFSVKGEGVGALIRFADDYEIQGNIYEHPHLLEGATNE